MVRSLTEDGWLKGNPFFVYGGSENHLYLQRNYICTEF